ncbi:putative immunity protein [Methanoculleus sp.]|uniref:putative immunity protein n=1 Tax=Methanoculleus sp. TaxID=90427 RepID=UPI002FC97F15
MKKHSKEDRVTMAAWAADCAERVLPLFDEAYPGDGRPRRAIEACRTWVRTGVFSMAEIRGASLGAHAAARDAEEGSAAQFAARAAGQAVATAHVSQHAYGAAYYALKAVAAADPANAGVNVAREREWQAERLPEGLREEIMERIVVVEHGGGFVVRLRKGEGF